MNALLLAVTLVSLVATAISLAVAWRVVRDDRRRSEARVAALSEAIYEQATDRPVDVAPLFEHASPRSTTRLTVVALGTCAAAIIAGLTLMAARTPTKDASAPPHAVDGGAPLELLALEHDREGNQLIVRGLVRNPANGATRDGLTAVVLAFDRSGDLVASARGAVPAAHLTANETTRFLVRIPGAADVSRFRVSFRTGTHVEAHVDHRAHGDAPKEVEP